MSGSLALSLLLARLLCREGEHECETGDYGDGMVQPSSAFSSSLLFTKKKCARRNLFSILAVLLLLAELRDLVRAVERFYRDSGWEQKHVMCLALELMAAVEGIY